MTRSEMVAFPWDVGREANESRRVLVTGAAGRLGAAVLADLFEHDIPVRGVDRIPIDRSAPGGPHMTLDGTDVGQLVTAMRGCRAVIHLGAIPAPNRHTDDVVFRNNTAATFAVLQAAAATGVRRVVVASSASILGHAWAPTDVFPDYAPVDERHPLRPLDPYALSKAVDELTCRTFAARYGMNIPMLRLSTILTATNAKLWAKETATDPLSDWHRPRVLWSYVDIRDAAATCRLALTSPTVGARAYNVTAADTLAPLDTAELLETYAPTVRITRTMIGSETAWSLDRARDELGYEPQFSWRDGDR